jgi:L-iditol 2-dehydrogenase
MKVGILSPDGVALADQPFPRARAGEVVVRLAACGVCGTDLEKLRGNYQTAGILGHEPVGVVEEVGEGVTDLSPGNRVFVHHHIPCYHCEVCASGAYTFCPSYSKTNLDPGGFAEAFRVSRAHVEAKAVLPLDPAISWEEGSLLEPAACALTALRAVGFRSGSTVFILGLGPVGLLYGRVAKALGAGWVGGAEISQRRSEAARRDGFDEVVDPRKDHPAQDAVAHHTDSRGVDLAVVATGAAAALRTALDLPRRGGTINLFGLPEPGQRLETELQPLYLRGVRIVPTYATTEPEIAEVHRLMSSGRLRVRDLITHRVPLAQIGEAFRLAGSPEQSIKVVVTGDAFSPASSRSGPH